MIGAMTTAKKTNVINNLSFVKFDEFDNYEKKASAHLQLIQKILFITLFCSV